MSEETNTQEREVVRITISGVLEDLNNGLTREDIQEKYGLNGVELKEVFQHPKLKGKKTKKPRGFVLIDDTEKDVIASEAEVPTNIEVEESPVLEEAALEPEPEMVEEPEVTDSVFDTEEA